MKGRIVSQSKLLDNMAAMLEVYEHDLTEDFIFSDQMWLQYDGQGQYWKGMLLKMSKYIYFVPKSPLFN